MPAIYLFICLSLHYHRLGQLQLVLKDAINSYWVCLAVFRCIYITEMLCKQKNPSYFAEICRTHYRSPASRSPRLQSAMCLYSKRSLCQYVLFPSVFFFLTEDQFANVFVLVSAPHKDQLVRFLIFTQLLKPFDYSRGSNFSEGVTNENTFY